MKKRILLIPLILLLTSGCVNINKVNRDELVNEIVTDKHNLYNHINKGYKYYLPRGLKSEKVDEYNDVIKGDNVDYYLYVDLVSYDKKIDVLLQKTEDSYYSKEFESKNKIKGIVNITKLDSKYLVKITYNYATIQFKCNEGEINNSLANGLIIVLSVDYNDSVVKKLLESSNFKGTEEAVNIFEKVVEDSDKLTVDDTYTGNEEEDYDPNVIQKRGED